MAHYLVKAQYQNDLLAELRTRLDSGEINKMRPFGTALQYSLDHARLDPQGQGWIVWEEEDYCTPPLAQERPRAENGSLAYAESLRTRAARPTVPGQATVRIFAAP